MDGEDNERRFSTVTVGTEVFMPGREWLARFQQELKKVDTKDQAGSWYFVDDIYNAAKLAAAIEEDV